MRGKLLKYAKEKYGSVPEYLWLSSPNSAVLRHDDNKKWYVLFMEVKRSVFSLGEGNIQIMNIKCNVPERECLIAENKAFPAYHMNKRLWTSVLLDGSTDYNSLCNLIDESFKLTE
ncbi:MAG: MmcQ/YjbR family DNA-binding protein [Ruminococcus sp.]|nr:MmcQ/YjbR family DNA-binding protein [Ruminococcus sp.]MBR6385869.1 MmcQ/YjbR family DNA-binding protein [Ruminococcus sp.]